MGTYDTRGGTPASPNDPDYAASELVEKVLDLLEAAGLPEGLNDTIVDLIEGWELEQATAHERNITDDDIALMGGPKQ